MCLESREARRIHLEHHIRLVLQRLEVPGTGKRLAQGGRGGGDLAALREDVGLGQQRLGREGQRGLHRDRDAALCSRFRPERRQRRGKSGVAFRQLPEGGTRRNRLRQAQRGLFCGTLGCCGPNPHDQPQNGQRSPRLCAVTAPVASSRVIAKVHLPTPRVIVSSSTSCWLFGHMALPRREQII